MAEYNGLPLPECAPSQIAGGPYGFGGINPNSEEERRRYHVQHCCQVLRQAREIRRDAALMADIRAYLRTEVDVLAELIDEGTP